ncbi:hypothetical protein [Achromobacter xylosoxidans]|uniref:hypothetical protein n=1 Tax=Alcaligenes xylosoxydans xylosoxydans TaxID=85698 RepID=UPI000478A585|nr:hypothetical protein [Achromobacter xylosoxidans]
MDLKQLEDIANRKTTCHTWGETVSISRAERDALVALAYCGLRYQWLRAALESDNTAALEALVAQPIPRTAEQFDEAIEAAMAAEIGKNMEKV